MILPRIWFGPGMLWDGGRIDHNAQDLCACDHGIIACSKLVESFSDAFTSLRACQKQDVRQARKIVNDINSEAGVFTQVYCKILSAGSREFTFEEH